MDVVQYNRKNAKMSPQVPKKSKKRQIMKAMLSSDWTWVSKIAKESKLPKQTVSYYLNMHLRDFIEELSMEQEIQNVLRLRLIRIKPDMKDDVTKIFNIRPSKPKEPVETKPTGAIKKISKKELEEKYL